MAEDRFDEKVIPAKGEKLIRGRSDDVLLQVILGCDRIDNPGPAHVHARIAELFHQRLWMEDARLCEIDVACYFNAALDNITNV